MNLDYKNFAVVYEPEIDAMVTKLDKSGIFKDTVDVAERIIPVYNFKVKK